MEVSLPSFLLNGMFTTTFPLKVITMMKSFEEMCPSNIVKTLLIADLILTPDMEPTATTKNEVQLTVAIKIVSLIPE
jgi:hypothetical protein